MTKEDSLTRSSTGVGVVSATGRNASDLKKLKASFKHLDDPEGRGLRFGLDEPRAKHGENGAKISASIPREVEIPRAKLSRL
jgi:hypothetical protein